MLLTPTKNKIMNTETPETELLADAPCSPLRELIKDELRDLWQRGYDRESRDESVQHRLDAIMRIIEANVTSSSTP